MSVPRRRATAATLKGRKSRIRYSIIRQYPSGSALVQRSLTILINLSDAYARLTRTVRALLTCARRTAAGATFPTHHFARTRLNRLWSCVARARTKEFQSHACGRSPLQERAARASTVRRLHTLRDVAARNAATRERGASGPGADSGASPLKPAGRKVIFSVPPHLQRGRRGTPLRLARPTGPSSRSAVHAGLHVHVHVHVHRRGPPRRDAGSKVCEPGARGVLGARQHSFHTAARAHDDVPAAARGGCGPQVLGAEGPAPGGCGQGGGHQ